jgi:nucleoid-associated protein YgaU
LRLAFLATALVGVLATAGRGGEQATIAASSRRYVVQPGDTLWGIARREVGLTGDPRPVIEDIRAANRLQAAALTPGLRLILP